MDTNVLAPTDGDLVTFGDKTVEIVNYERYKGRKGVTDRLALVSKNLIRVFTYYLEAGTQKHLFRAPKDPTTLKLCKDKMGEPSQRFGLVLFHYLSDDSGEMMGQEAGPSLKGKIKLWVITENRYEELTGIHKKWSLLDAGFVEKQYDLQAKCTEEQFQRMQFTVCPEAHWKSKQSWYDALKSREIKAIDLLKMALGKTMKDDEIKALLGVGGGSMPAPGSTDNSGDIDLSDIVN